MISVFFTIICIVTLLAMADVVAYLVIIKTYNRLWYGSRARTIAFIPLGALYLIIFKPKWFYEETAKVIKEQCKHE